MKIKANTLREESLEQLSATLLKQREELLKLRFKKANGSLEDKSRLKWARRSVAVILTVIKEKESK